GETGLVNRHGWLHEIANEEDRCRRTGSRGAVIVVRAVGPGAPGAVVAAMTGVLLQETRAHDVVARLGAAEFAVLAVDCDDVGASASTVRFGCLWSSTFCTGWRRRHTSRSWPWPSGTRRAGRAAARSRSPSRWQRWRWPR